MSYYLVGVLCLCAGFMLGARERKHSVSLNRYGIDPEYQDAVWRRRWRLTREDIEQCSRN